MRYPYTPKSNNNLSIGDYWVIQLRDSSYSVGIVIDIPPKEMKTRTMLIAGLLDWNSKSIPTKEVLFNLKVLAQGEIHIKSIVSTGKEVVGNINLGESGIKPLIQCSSSERFNYSTVNEGYKVIRKMNESDLQSYSVLGTWGYHFIKTIAEKHFLK